MLEENNLDSGEEKGNVHLSVEHIRLGVYVSVWPRFGVGIKET